MMVTLSLDWNAAMALRWVFDLNWRIACVRITGTPFNIMWNIFTIPLWNPLVFSYSSTTSASVRCIIWISTCISLQRRVTCITNTTGESKIAISLNMGLALQLSTAYQHPCREKLGEKMWYIVPWTTKNGVTSCPNWRINTIVIGTLPK